MNKFCTNLCILISLIVFGLTFIFTTDPAYFSSATISSIITTQNSRGDKVIFSGRTNSKVYKVTKGKVTDGDTFQLHRGGSQFTVRLACVDTPELTQAYGKEAKQFVEHTFFTYDNNVTYQDLGKDSFGRTIALVFLPTGESINQFLVRNGWAFPYEQYKDNCPIWDQITQAESIAVKHDINLFGLNTLRPWIYRRLKKSSSLS